MNEVHIVAKYPRLALNRLDLASQESPVDVLFLEGCGITNDVLRAVGDLSSLQHLAIFGGSYDAGGLSAIRRCRRLQSIALVQSVVANGDLAVIGKHESIRRILVDSPLITSSAVEHLTSITLLEELSAAGTRLDDDVGPFLSKFSVLRHLDLCYTGVSDDIVRYLIPLPLKNLYLDRTDVSDTSVGALGQITSLRRLDLYHTRISTCGVQSLRRCLDGCVVNWSDRTMSSA